MIKRLNNKHLLVLLAILPILALFGCSKKDKEKASVKVPTSSAQKAKTQSSSPAATPVQKSISSARQTVAASSEVKARKDPFVPFIQDTKQSKATKTSPQPQQGRIRNRGDLLPIQSFDVDKFKVSGIIVGLKENKALIVDPTGKGYVVKEGMVIGSNDGRITKIRPSSIEVVERYSEGSGRMKSRKIVLPLAKKKQGDTR